MLGWRTDEAPIKPRKFLVDVEETVRDIPGVEGGCEGAADCISGGDLDEACARTGGYGCELPGAEERRGTAGLVVFASERN